MYLIQDINKDTMVFDSLGFTIIDPLGVDCYIEWKIIDTILLALNTTDCDCAEWIIFLNESPKWIKKGKISWLAKFSFFIRDKKYKKIRIQDNCTINFYEFPAKVEKYLLKNDDKMTELIYKTKKNINEEYWNPRYTNDLPYKMLYDRYNRTVEDIYKRDRAI
jgi:hypothetical protein